MSGISTTGTGDAILDADNDFTPPDKNIFRDNTIFREAGETSAVGIQMNTTSTANELAFSSNADGDPNYLTMTGTAQGVITLFGANSQINLEGAGSKIIFPDNTEQTTASSSLPLVRQEEYTSVLTQSVTSGNPTDASPDSKNGVIPEYSVTMSVTSTFNDGVVDRTAFRVSGQSIGEWSGNGWDTGLGVLRTHTPAGGSATTTILRAPSNGSRGRLLTTFCIVYSNNSSTTMECGQVNIIDDFPASIGDSVKYQFILLNFSSTQSFKHNRVYSGSDGLGAERGKSWISVTEVTK